MTFIAEHIAQVRERIAAACARAGRSENTVRLIAVSKTQPFEVIMKALEAGVRDFGENRIDEAEAKIQAFRRDVRGMPVRWHMIGHIQSKKAKLVPPLFDLVHSVDDRDLAVKLSTRAQEHTVRLPILVQVNVSGEASKSGLAATGWQDDSAVLEQVLDDMRSILAQPYLEVRGLMTMAPIVEHPEQVRPVFASLAAMRNTLRDALQVDLPELSMGMTDDFEVAIEEGATMIRVGRALFGERRL